MGSGTINYKKLPEKKKVFGDKYFFIRPLNLGLDKTYYAFIVRPPQSKDETDFKLCIEGEFNWYPDGNTQRYKEIKEEYEEQIVKFVYYKDELNDFPANMIEDIKQYCNFAI